MSRFACLLVAVIAISVASVSAAGTNWAVLVAGSAGYDNYRHQADICHAWQIFNANGFESSNVVTMLYDDVANSSENPYPGTLINKPNGSDVYGGVVKDYVGNDVTPDNFLKILAGKDMTGVGSGKTIKSTSNDRITFVFADHGAPGLVAFPTGDFLYAHDLHKTLKSMYENKQYKEMVLYVEACESGSMFNKMLPKDWNIYATTAADPNESSYACYWDAKRETYLGDCYSVNWMEDDDKGKEATETLKQQFSIVKGETNTSHVCAYGDLDMNSETVSVFFGAKSSHNAEFEPIHHSQVGHSTSSIPQAVSTYDVRLQTLLNRLNKALNEENTDLITELNEKISEEFANRRRHLQFWKSVKKHSKAVLGLDLDLPERKNAPTPTTGVCHDSSTALDFEQLECMKQINNRIRDQCSYKHDDFSMQFIRMVRDACANRVEPADFEKVLERAC